MYLYIYIYIFTYIENKERYPSILQFLMSLLVYIYISLLDMHEPDPQPLSRFAFTKIGGYSCKSAGYLYQAE